MQNNLLQTLLATFERRVDLEAFMNCYVWPAFKAREAARREAEYERQRVASRERREAERQAKHQAKAAAKVPPPVEPHPRYVHIDGSPIPVSGPGALDDLARKHIPVVRIADGKTLMPELNRDKSVTCKSYRTSSDDAALEAHIQKYKNQT
jgi:hypothetical protein